VRLLVAGKPPKGLAGNISVVEDWSGWILDNFARAAVG
jgi:hypothetical protein